MDAAKRRPGGERGLQAKDVPTRLRAALLLRATLPSAGGGIRRAPTRCRTMHRVSVGNRDAVALHSLPGRRFSKVIVLIRKPFRPLVLGVLALTLAISPVAAQRSEGAPPEARRDLGRARAAAGRLRHRAHARGRGREARLHGDRRHAVAVRPERRALGRDLLHGLCAQGRAGGDAAGHLRVQRRPGRIVRLSASRPRRSAGRRLRCGA